jgi:hypothetical protein
MPKVLIRVHPCPSVSGIAEFASSLATFYSAHCIWPAFAMNSRYSHNSHVTNQSEV